MPFPIQEPEWILDQHPAGTLFWRRDSNEAKRVKFRYDVEVKEFHRVPHELDTQDWIEENNDIVTMSLTCILCITLTVILPLYILTGKY